MTTVTTRAVANPGAMRAAVALAYAVTLFPSVPRKLPRLRGLRRRAPAVAVRARRRAVASGGDRHRPRGRLRPAALDHGAPGLQARVDAHRAPSRRARHLRARGEHHARSFSRPMAAPSGGGVERRERDRRRRNLGRVRFRLGDCAVYDLPHRPLRDSSACARHGLTRRGAASQRRASKRRTSTASCVTRCSSAS